MTVLLAWQRRGRRSQVWTSTKFSPTQPKPWVPRSDLSNPTQGLIYPRYLDGNTVCVGLGSCELRLAFIAFQLEKSLLQCSSAGTSVECFIQLCQSTGVESGPVKNAPMAWSRSPPSSSSKNTLMTLLPSFRFLFNFGYWLCWRWRQWWICWQWRQRRCERWFCARARLIVEFTLTTQHVLRWGVCVDDDDEKTYSGWPTVIDRGNLSWGREGENYYISHHLPLFIIFFGNLCWSHLIMMIIFRTLRLWCQRLCLFLPRSSPSRCLIWSDQLSSSLWSPSITIWSVIIIIMICNCPDICLISDHHRHFDRQLSWLSGWSWYHQSSWSSSSLWSSWLSSSLSSPWLSSSLLSPWLSSSLSSPWLSLCLSIMVITLSDSLTVLTGHVVLGIKSSLPEIYFVIVLFLRRRKSAETMLEFVDHRLDLFLLPDDALGNKHKRHLVDITCAIFLKVGA